jgi:uncharacterized membrane protein YeaQ/YmgE (transglycosylase-associated protein family)
MNIIMSMLVGCILGWAGYSLLGFNEARGKIASISIGALGGLVGGQMVAPMFTAPASAAVASGDLSFSVLAFAAAVAAAFLAVSNLVYNRWGL